jgi:hypothetical protein
VLIIVVSQIGRYFAIYVRSIHNPNVDTFKKYFERILFLSRTYIGWSFFQNISGTNLLYTNTNRTKGYDFGYFFTFCHKGNLMIILIECSVQTQNCIFCPIPNFLQKYLQSIIILIPHFHEFQ